MRKRRSRHASERAEQRLGVKFSDKELEEIEKILHYGGGVAVQGFSRSSDDEPAIVYDLKFRGKPIRAVYKPHTRFLVTIMEQPPKIGTRLQIPSRR